MTATGLIDMHHHFLPRPVFEDLKEMAGASPRLVTERISMTLSPALPDTGLHTETMAAAGVGSALLTYSGVSVLGPDVCRRLNDGLADVQRENPGVLFGAAHVDLQEPDSAPAELARCAGELGLAAVALPTSMPGVQLDDRRLDPIWEAVDSLGWAVLLHPPLLPEGATVEYNLERSCYRPFDTTTAAVRILCGVLPRYPSMRFVLPHCGGAAAFLKGRLQMFFNVPGGPSRTLPRTQNESRAEGTDAVFAKLWDRLYVDTAGTGGWGPAVGFTLNVMGPERVCFGSDYPLEAHSAETLTELVEAAGSASADPEVLNALRRRTAEGLLGPLPPVERCSGGG